VEELVEHAIRLNINKLVTDKLRKKCEIFMSGEALGKALTDGLIEGFWIFNLDL
jgi:hypothetical protein